MERQRYHYILVIKHSTAKSQISLKVNNYLFLEHVLPLLPHFPHQLDQVRNTIASLNFLQCCIKQTEGTSTANTRAARNRKKYLSFSTYS